MDVTPCQIVQVRVLCKGGNVARTVKVMTLNFKIRKNQSRSHESTL